MGLNQLVANPHREQTFDDMKGLVLKRVDVQGRSFQVPHSDLKVVKQPLNLDPRLS